MATIRLRTGVIAAPSRQVRGNSKDRRARRKWMVETFAYRGHTGALWLLCRFCLVPCRADSLEWEVDRHPVHGHAGGRYVRTNIVPSCLRCNRGRCSACPK